MTRFRSLLLAGGLTVLVIAAALGFSARLAEGGPGVATPAAAIAQPATDNATTLDQADPSSPAQRAPRFELERDHQDEQHEESERHARPRGSGRQVDGRNGGATYQYHEDEDHDD
jgi:hypothetical protein